jgi:hypothetical protein
MGRCAGLLERELGQNPTFEAESSYVCEMDSLALRLGTSGVPTSSMRQPLGVMTKCQDTLTLV